MNADDKNRKSVDRASNKHGRSEPLIDETEHFLHTILANVEDLSPLSS
jgi:hypothetical protein